MGDEAAQSYVTMDPQTTINEVVNSVKSEGLFDQFRKECLEEFENMETYYQLKQSVENHVASFLARHKFHDGLQKNSLRNELRNHISRSEVLLNGIQRLVDEVLSRKGHSFCLKIDKQVDKFLNPNLVEPGIVEDSAVNQNENSTSKQEVSNVIVQKTITNMDHTSSQVSKETGSQSFQQEVTSSNQTGNEQHAVSIQGPDEEEGNIVTEIEEVGMEMDENFEGDNENENEENKEEEQIDEAIDIKHTIQKPVAEQISVDKQENQDKQLETVEDNSLKSSSEENDGAVDKQSEKELEETIAENSSKNKDEISAKEDDGKNENIELQQEQEATDNDKSKSDKREESNTEIVKTNETKENTPKSETRNNDKNQDVESKTKIDTTMSYYSSFQTEPISDDSTSNSFDSNFDQISEASETLDDKQVDEAGETAIRKSKRVRNVPLKFRTEEASKKDGYDSISSTDTDAADDKKRSRNKNRSKQQEKTVEKPPPTEESRSTTRQGRIREKEHENTKSHHSKQRRSPSSSESNRSVSLNTKRKTRSRGDSPPPRAPPKSRDSSNTRTADSRDDSSFKRSRRPTKQRERYSPSL